ncbi:unnamed protein product [Prorocentrum cordatum]|uniref:Uncharacterized protein n=1 Tax=Prorocentrum cordatum TaxID=2364126 RepID=A0ABN9PKB2_9DINO|nr:unnamed protein product [Polarella glacialis]
MTCESFLLLQADLDYTQRIDTAVGCKENAQKRQAWTRVDSPPTLVKQFGIATTLVDPTHPIWLLGGWDKLHAAIITLGSVPRGIGCSPEPGHRAHHTSTVLGLPACGTAPGTDKQGVVQCRHSYTL